jgi:hypothetical protein
LRLGKFARYDARSSRRPRSVKKGLAQSAPEPPRSSEEQTQLLTDIRHDCVRTSLRSSDDAATGDVQETIDEPLQATQSRRMKYPAG